jgi:hypothetical protein
MANPTPIYKVYFDGQQLPGYVQSEDRPLSLRSIVQSVIGRDGANRVPSGGNPRKISLTLLLKSRLSSGTELQHLEDCKNQWRDALKILSRAEGEKALRIQDSDRYYLGSADGISAPIVAGQSRSMNYSIDFTASIPWAIAVTPATQTFTGNGAISITIGDSRKTYPIFTVPSGVTAFTATDENGKVLQFLRGAHTGTITIDCGEYIVINNSGVSAVTSMVNLGFGLHYKGTDGTYEITISGFAGSGTVTVDMYGRYEL